MDQEKLTYTYSGHLREMLHRMMKENYQTDVTLVSDDNKQVKAHKIVLSACSTVFKDIVDSISHYDPVIHLKDIQYLEVESLLDFMYLGETTIYGSRRTEFLNAAKSLDLKHISKNIEIKKMDTEVLKENITNSNNSSVEEKATNTQNIQETKLKKHKCYQCKYQTSHSFRFKQHVQSVHDGVKIDCSFCLKKFADKSNLKKHIQSKHEGMKFPCSKCQLQYTTYSSLKLHIDAEHKEIRYNCLQCNYQGKTQYQLKQHYKATHEGVRYSCEKCDAKFKTKDSVMQHIETVHGNSKQFFCYKCDKQFSRKCSVKLHMESVHENIKQFICGKCEKQFSRKCSLKLHIESVHKDSYQTISNLPLKLT